MHSRKPSIKKYVVKDTLTNRIHLANQKALLIRKQSALFWPYNSLNIFQGNDVTICFECIAGICGAERKKFVFTKDENNTVHFPEIVKSLPLFTIGKMYGCTERTINTKQVDFFVDSKEICPICLVKPEECNKKKALHHLSGFPLLNKKDVHTVIDLKKKHLNRMNDGYREVKRLEVSDNSKLEKSIRGKYLFNDTEGTNDRNLYSPCLACHVGKCKSQKDDFCVKDNLFHLPKYVHPFEYNDLVQLHLDIIFECGIKTPYLIQDANVELDLYDEKFLCLDCHVKPGPSLDRSCRFYKCKKESKIFHRPTFVREFTLQEVNRMIDFILEYTNA